MKELIVMSFMMMAIVFSIVSCSHNRSVNFNEDQQVVVVEKKVNPNANSKFSKGTIIDAKMDCNRAEMNLEMELESGNKEVIATARRMLDEAEVELDEALRTPSRSVFH